MKQILDYLRDYGVDTEKLINKPSDDSQAEEVPNIDSVAPVSPEMLGMPPSGPNSSKSEGIPNFFSTPVTNNTSTPLHNANTDNVPASNGMDPTTFAGFPKSYDTLNEMDNTEPEDQTGTGKTGGSTKHGFSVSGKGGVGDAQKQALQNAINGGGFTNNTVAGLKAAQDEADSQKGTNNLLRGISQIAQGAAGVNFKAKDVNIDNTLANLKGLDKEADQGVQNFKDRGEQEKNDPKSALSVSARAFAAPLLAKMGMTLPDNVSFAGMEKLNPRLTDLYDHKTNQENQNKLMQLKYAELNEYKKQGAQKKTTDEQTRNFKTVQGILESNKANPAVQQAETTIANAKKLQEIVGDKDPDSLSTEMMGLATMEVAKMAMGGAITEGELKALKNGAFPGRVASSLQKLTNKPVAANQGEFLNQYLDYSKGLEKVAQEVIQDKYGRVIKSNKSHLHPNDYDTLQENYVNRFAPKVNKKLTTTGKIAVSNGKQSFEIDPSDLEHANKEGYKQVK